MKMKNNDLVGTVREPPLLCAGEFVRVQRSVFCFLFLIFCLSTPLAAAEISSGQSGLANVLISHLAKLSQDVNTPKVSGLHSRTPSPQLWSVGDFGEVGSTQAAKVQSSRQEQSQTSNTAPVNRRLLWQAGFSIAKDQKDNKSKNELQRIIEQIRSVELKPKNQAPEPVIAVEPAPTTGPNEILSDTETPKEPNEKEIESKQPAPFCNKSGSPLAKSRKIGPSQNVNPLPYEPVNDQTLQLLENLLQHPDQADNPFELGEILFLSDCLKEAGVFYQEALNRSSPDKVSSAQNRAWILFQIGNCLKDDDPLTAMKMYRQLIAEYPDSLWADLAKARNKLIDWYQQDKPQTLIAESQ